jgi:hypothetical protein
MIQQTLGYLKDMRLSVMAAEYNRRKRQFSHTIDKNHQKIEFGAKTTKF